MKHAGVQRWVAGVVLVGTQGIAWAEVPDRAPPPSIEIASARESVDADAVMSVRPGEGAGIFVQYASGGHWNVFTACDTNRSNQPCRFDILISADSTVAFSDPQGQQLEPVDVLTLGADGSIRLQTGTALKLDGVSFDADPGATIRVDVLLDGEARPDLLNWISGGELRQGATDDPVDFTPTSR
jgi:hypothetical protein